LFVISGTGEDDSTLNTTDELLSEDLSRNTEVDEIRLEDMLILSSRPLFRID